VYTTVSNPTWRKSDVEVVEPIQRNQEDNFAVHVNFRIWLILARLLNRTTQRSGRDVHEVKWYFLRQFRNSMVAVQANLGCRTHLISHD
jgi:hypothetical protein